jgi:hypothetical protein
MTKWCEVCDEIEALHAGKTLCWNCYMRTNYAVNKGVAWIMERRKNLKTYLRGLNVLLGEMDVHDIDEARDKKEKTKVA